MGTMQRTNTRLIKLPTLLVAGQNYNGDNDSAEEMNVKAYDYVRRTAVPTLEDYVITPFGDAFKDKTFKEAVQKYGVDAEGILLGRHVTEEIIGAKKYVVDVFSTTRIQYETVFSFIQEFLEKIKVDNLETIRKDCIRKVDDEPHVFIEYLLEEIARQCNNNSTTFNKKDLEVQEKGLDKEGLEVYKKAALDDSITEMLVALDMTRLAQINEKNADEFHKAKSLKAKLEAFKREFEAGLMNRYGINPNGIDEQVEFDYELSDGTGVRYLFFKKISLPYGDVYGGLVTKNTVREKTKSVTKDYGDLDIVKDFAFKDPYLAMRAGVGIQVRTDMNGSQKGKLVIGKFSKSGSEERSYKVFDNEGKVYVSVNDVMATIEKLKKDYTSVSTEQKIDFFAALPQHLR